MKNGGTPLHWATTKEVVTALLELGCLIDARNFNGETALHVMVQRDRFECVVTLLSHGADPNLVDNLGKSPLHVAAALASLPLVQVNDYIESFLNYTLLSLLKDRLKNNQLTWQVELPVAHAN